MELLQRDAFVSESGEYEPPYSLIVLLAVPPSLWNRAISKMAQKDRS
jgi:hypothetical protein